MRWTTPARFRLRMGVTLAALVLTVLLGALASGVVVVAFLLVLYLFAATPGRLPSVVVLSGMVGLTAVPILLVVAWGERRAPQYAVAATGASRVRESDRPELHSLVRTVAQQADTPVPAVSVAPTETPLSLTTGFRPANSRLVVSEGLLDLVDAPELRAVVAHELAHVKNRDVAVMTAAALPLGAAGRIRELLSGPTQAVEHGTPSRADHADALVTVGLGLVFPATVLARLLWASLSRAREYAADRGAVAITGEPAALAAALERIDTRLAERPPTDLRNAEMAAFAIVEPGDDPVRGSFAGVRRGLRRAVATHPTTADRIGQLQAIERTQERS